MQESRFNFTDLDEQNTVLLKHLSNQIIKPIELLNFKNKKRKSDRYLIKENI